MHLYTIHVLRRLRLSGLLFSLGTLVGLLAPSTLLAQAAGTGNIEGRAFNASSGFYLNNARIAADGTNLETSTDENGNYRLANVPAGFSPARMG